MTDDELLRAAADVRARSHSPYSNYRVGAAVLDDAGNLHVGCNVESASYPEGICAEANAIGSMVSAGGRRIVAIAVVGNTHDEAGVDSANRSGPAVCTPCGGCRQRILEFADENTRIIMLDAGNQAVVFSIDDLLPHSFGANS